ncbi:MAG: hypothetical protein ACYCQI_16865 [Gammaproteobacteria bacterium]
MQRFSLLIASLFILSLSTTTLASRQCSIEFFASNNTATIDLQTAYQRLQGHEQHQLQESMIDVLQKNHIEQGKFQDILGTYQMSASGNITADNTDVFITSPYQCINEQKIFYIAKQLANEMKQESVAVFISSQHPVVGELKVIFINHKPTINEVISLLHNKLPPSYNQAFSLHLTGYADFDKAKVSEIEWLGSKININDIKNVFPNENITYQYGKAYLVYKNGQKEQL